MIDTIGAVFVSLRLKNILSEETTVAFRKKKYLGNILCRNVQQKGMNQLLKIKLFADANSVK